MNDGSIGQPKPEAIKYFKVVKDGDKFVQKLQNWNFNIELMRKNVRIYAKIYDFF